MTEIVCKCISSKCLSIRYVAFDPLGHKLITGISNAPHNQSQWDRVANPSRRESSLASTSHGSQPRSVMMPADQERRITVCYRSLVEQYEQLVQRYYDLSRSRTPTVCIEYHILISIQSTDFLGFRYNNSL